MQIGLGRFEDGSKIVLDRFFFRFVVRARFFGRFGLLLGSFLVVLGISWVRFQTLRGVHMVLSESGLSSVRTSSLKTSFCQGLLFRTIFFQDLLLSGLLFDRISSYRTFLCQDFFSQDLVLSVSPLSGPSFVRTFFCQDLCLEPFSVGS